MSSIERAGQPGSAGEIDVTQGEYRQQLDAITDAVRQLVGDADVGSDPLNSKFTLYVDPVLGRDTFVAGDYKSAPNTTFEDKMRRISLQRLACGYSQHMPFRTLNRAVIEAGLITSRSYLNLDSKPCGDLVTIVMSTGVHTLLNDRGAASTSSWSDGYEPTDNDLIAFNKANGGIILPRGCSVVSLDLRKTILRPNYVPAPATETAGRGNGSGLLSMTSGGYYYGLTFMDKLDATASHHLLHCFEYTSKAELDLFYSKIRDAFTAEGDISSDYAQSRTSEYEIVAAVPADPNVSVDTVKGASPYIYNCSIRSVLGLCGVYADGSKSNSSFNSTVIAQFTGVSLQNDYSCWQVYTGSSWKTVSDSAEFLAADPDDIRMNPDRLSFHIRTANEAVIQNVSVFSIGQGVQMWAESGSQQTTTNSNSNFGGCASLASGFQRQVAKDDGPWTLDNYRVALSPLAKTGNINVIPIGVLSNNNPDETTTLRLTSDLAESTVVSGQPAILASDGYSLKKDDYIWIENPGGRDYRAKLSNNPWSSANANEIKIQKAVETDDGQVPGAGDDANAYPAINGKRVYVRRLVDTRSVEERRYSILASNNDATKDLRLPIRDYVIAPTNKNQYSDLVQAVAASEQYSGSSDIKVELRYSNKPKNQKSHSSSVYYRKGDVVVKSQKHFFATRDSYGAFNLSDWDESYVHMPSGANDAFIPEGKFTNAQPIIVFDKDTDGKEDSTDLGNSLNDAAIKAQIYSAVDLLGLQYFLQNLGQSGLTNKLQPVDSESQRNKTIASKEFEFRRPTNIRLFGHSWEWAGFGSYSRALPQYQGEMSPNNKFTYYFTNEAGGKVYATGFNEEGLQVSPRGLEDITTGQVLSVDQIGSPDRDISVPTSFPDLVAEKSLTLGFKKIGKMESHALVEGQQGFDDKTQEKLSAFGVVKLAGISDLDNKAAAGTDAKISENPLVVTAAGLNYWKAKNNLVSAPDDEVFIFVDPVNGVDRSIEKLIDEPPTFGKPLKTLMTATEYVNQLYSEKTVVEYRCGPGIYYDDGRDFNEPIVFKTIARLVAWDYGTNKLLNNSKGGGTKPFMGVSANGKTFNVAETFPDPNNQPTFLTLTRMSVDPSGTRPNLIVLPLTLQFKEAGSIEGFAWYGSAQTLANPNVDDKFWTARSWVTEAEITQARSGATIENALDKFVKAVIAQYGAPDGLNSVSAGTVTGSCCIFEKEGFVANCAIGAVIPQVYGEVAFDSQSIFQTQGAELILRGIYLIGNVQLSSAQGVKFRGIDVYKFWGHQEALVNINIRSRPEDKMLLSLGGGREASLTDHNFAWNNIHLLNNSYQVASDPNTENLQELGPAFGSIFGMPLSFATTRSGNWLGNVNQVDGEYQGFNGMFGKLKKHDSSDTAITRGIFGYNSILSPELVPGGFSSLMTEHTAIVKAGTGERPADTGYPGGDGDERPVKDPGEAGPDEYFAPLNVKVIPFKKGIDVVGAVTVKRNCKL